MNKPAELRLETVPFWINGKPVALQRSQSIVPGNAMPNLQLSPQEARDIAAYLYTLD